jgi:proteasome assembly chaperone (PAC2) family protein
MEFLRVDHLPSLRAPVMIAAFAGWNDAAEVATGVVNHLVTRWSATSFASIDPEEFYDFTQTRPQVKMVSPNERRIDWPANTFHAYVDSRGDHDYLLFVGVEPQLRWRAFTTSILELAQQCGITSLVCIGGLLAEVTHNRPPRVSGSGTAGVAGAGAQARHRGRAMRPTGIVGV